METVLNSSHPLLGEELVRRALIPPGRLIRALEIQQRTGGRLGDILVGENMIGYYDLYHTIAECLNLPFIDLLKEPPTVNLLNAEDSEQYLQHRFIPWRRNGLTLIIAICDVSDTVLDAIRASYGNNTQLVITSPLDIRRTIEKYFGKILENDSCLSLWKHLPEISARETLTFTQRQILAGITFCLVACFVNWPVQCALAIVIFCQVAYCLTMAFKCLVFTASLKPALPENWDQKLATLDPADLPVYTVLIPMYKEAKTLPGMLEVLRSLDYPAHKLDIKLVLEADDTETIETACTLKPNFYFEIIRVPPGKIRTKPKACNYALRFARGEFVTIFDADDHPDPKQLKKAVYTFRNSPPDVVCLQARLNYYNTNANLLTAAFSLEYSILFNFMLRGLQRLGIPIPLGGTSNHIALDRLLEEGRWDPYNVTEDADLGVRFSGRGYRTIMLDSVTMEEAPHTLYAWIRQRSRWIKGYMQTWLVHMRRPAALFRTLGLRGFIGFQFFIGFSTFAFLSAPIVWGISLLWSESILHFYNVLFPAWLSSLMYFNIALNIVSLYWFAAACLPLYQKLHPRLIVAALGYPLYLFLHSIASYKALWQLIFKPHFWEKTSHGMAAAFANISLEKTFRKPSRQNQ